MSSSVMTNVIRSVELQTKTSETDYDTHYTLLTNYVAFMGYTILVWDHAITFGDEIHYIWARIARPNSSQRPLIYLFLFNRYFTPLAFIGNFVAYLAQWSTSHCAHFVRYEGACTAIALAVSELILWLRVRALYWNRKPIPFALLALWLIQQIVSVWLLTNGQEVKHREQTDRACTMIFSSKTGKFAPSLSAWFPLLFDTLVIGLVLYRCIPQRKMSTSHIINVLIRDGILYYGVLFSINLLLGIMIIAAQDATKNITAQLEQLLTVALISRITLSLQREGRRGMNNSTDVLVSSFDVKKNDIQHIEDIELAEPYPVHTRRRASEAAVRNQARQTPGFATHPRTLDRSIGSETRREHISVVAVTPMNQSIDTFQHEDPERLSRVDSEKTRVVSGWNSRDLYRGSADILEDDDEGTSTIEDAPTGATSFGVISISPQHTEEAARAASRYTRDLRPVSP